MNKMGMQAIRATFDGRSQFVTSPKFNDVTKLVRKRR